MREVGQALRSDPMDGKARGDRSAGSRAPGGFRGDPARSHSASRRRSSNGTCGAEFLKRLKNAYDERGIEIPFPHLTINTPKASAA